MALRGMGATVRRDQLTIMSDLLDIVQQPQRLTHILYKSNMSYGQLARYLDDLTELGFVESKSRPYRAYVVTQKGKQFNEMIGLKKQDVDSIRIEQFR